MITAEAIPALSHEAARAHHKEVNDAMHTEKLAWVEREKELHSLRDLLARHIADTEHAKGPGWRDLIQPNEAMLDPLTVANTPPKA